MSSLLAFSGVEWGGGWGFCLQAVSREISQVVEKEEERRGNHFCPLLCPSLQEMFPWYL